MIMAYLLEVGIKMNPPSSTKLSRLVKEDCTKINKEHLRNRKDEKRRFYSNFVSIRN